MVRQRSIGLGRSAALVVAGAEPLSPATRMEPGGLNQKSLSPKASIAPIRQSSVAMQMLTAALLHEFAA
jgi:hypothetical protein